MNHLSEEQLIFHYYGEPADRESIEGHLAACIECRAQYQSLQRVLNVVDGASLPDRRLDYGAEVWRGIESQLGVTRWPRWRGWLEPRNLALAASMAAMLLIAFFAGRSMAPQAAPERAGSTEAVRDRILLVAVGDHLDRSQMVLVELANAKTGSAVDITDEQKWAEELLGANRLYRQTAASAGDQGVAVVLEDLERLLVEIAHSPSTLSSAELGDIRRRIEAEGILFKIRVLGSRMRNPENLTNLESIKQ